MLSSKNCNKCSIPSNSSTPLFNNSCSSLIRSPKPKTFRVSTIKTNKDSSSSINRTHPVTLPKTFTSRTSWTLWVSSQPQRIKILISHTNNSKTSSSCKQITPPSSKTIHRSLISNWSQPSQRSRMLKINLSHKPHSTNNCLRPSTHKSKLRFRTNSKQGHKDRTLLKTMLTPITRHKTC